ncbi:acyltransferase family protein [Hymenobacter rubidus]|uniref:acyltransferase family protein n=1 Tax=Hymenobacter rubidus TaxID=1441626 RepID=UPI00191D8F6B|nr:hypothetical protein [Hymenobacter rubidus]
MQTSSHTCKGAEATLPLLLRREQPWHGFFGSFNFLFQFTYLGRAVEFFVGAALAGLLPRGLPVAPPHGPTYAGLAGMLLCLGGLSLLHGPAIGAFGVLTPAGMLLNSVALPLLGRPPLVLLGKSSYAFYLIHMGVGQQLLRGHLPNPVLPLLLLYGASILLYWLVEEPLNKWFRRVLGRARPTPLRANSPLGS